MQQVLRQLNQVFKSQYELLMRSNEIIYQGAQRCH